MRLPFRKWASGLLALAMCATLCLPAAAYSYALGEELRSSSTDLHQQTQLAENVFWSTYKNDFRTEHFLTYTPNARVRPIVTYGASVTRTSTLSGTAHALEAQGYRVVGGINGDFFNMGSGVPTGLVVAEGQLRSSDGGARAIGFLADGSAVIGKPSLQISADLGYTWYDESGYGTRVSRDIAAVNKVREAGGIYLFTYDFNPSHTTGNSLAGVDAICTITEGQLSIGGTVKARVDEVRQTSGGATPIEPNQIILSVSGNSSDYWKNGLLRMPVGSTVSITAAASDNRWNNVQYAMGSLYLYTSDGRLNGVQNPKITSGVLTEDSSPRTAIGQRPDGTLIFYTIDGRLSGYSYGASFLQSVERLMELGCTTVVGLDGGGSTTLTVTQPDATTAQTVNSPSGHTERYVSDHVFLVADSTPTGVLHHFYIRPEDNYVLGGSRVNLSVSGVDTNYIPMTAEYQLSADGGTLDGNVLTVPRQTLDVTVRAENRAGQTGSTLIHVIGTPDSLRILNSEGGAVSTLTVPPAGEVQLKASAVWNHAEIHADEGCFTWSVAGDMGTINDMGVFSARKPGTGKIIVQAGNRTAEIPVTVSRVALWEGEDFEDAIPGTGDNAGLTIAVGGELARFGRGAGRLDYDLTVTGRAQWRADTPFLTLGIPYDAVTIWVNGDNSGNTLSLLYRNGLGEETSLPICTLNFSGWRQALIPLGYASYASITGFEVTAPGVKPTEASGNVDPWGPPVAVLASADDENLASAFSPDQQEQARIWTADDGAGGAETFHPLEAAPASGASLNSGAASVTGASLNSGAASVTGTSLNGGAASNTGMSLTTPDGRGSVDLYVNDGTSGNAASIDSEDSETAVPVDSEGSELTAVPVDSTASEITAPVDSEDEETVLSAADSADDSAVPPPVGGTDDGTVPPPVDGTDDGTVPPPADGTDDSTVPPPVDGTDDSTVPPPVDDGDDGSGSDTPDNPPDSRKGTVYLDQLVATYDNLVDSTPPQVDVTLDEAEWELRASVRDTMDGILPRRSITVSYNGRPVTDFSYDTKSGFVRWTLPPLTGEYRENIRVTVTAADASGNIGRDSGDLPPINNEHHFTDIEGCWAADYIDFLYENNIAAPLAEGKYLPYEPITRVQFAVMLARAANLDGRLYAGVQLPYADLDRIPQDALPALRALWAENIMRGTDAPDGRKYLYPDNSLTRAQASAMIGRSQRLGYASASFLAFPDAPEIPAYAVSHIQTMVARGILQGYQDGSFRPGAAISRGQMAKILYFLA